MTRHRPGYTLTIQLYVDHLRGEYTLSEHMGRPSVQAAASDNRDASSRLGCREEFSTEVPGSLVCVCPLCGPVQFGSSCSPTAHAAYYDSFPRGDE